MDTGWSEQGVSENNSLKGISSSWKILSDNYTHEDLHPFKWAKKNKSLRRKEKLHIIAFDDDMVCTGLCLEALGSQEDGRRQAFREEQQNSEAKKRSNAYQSAFAKADEAPTALQLEHVVTVQQGGEENPSFSYDDDDLYKWLERTRNLDLTRKRKETESGSQVVLLDTTSVSSQTGDDQNPTSGESQENKIVLTEMEEFVWGLQLDEDHKTDNEDVLMEEDDAPKASDQEVKDEAGDWTEVKDTGKNEFLSKKDKEQIVLDEIVREVSLGKGLSGALKLLKQRGTLKETVEWDGRNIEKKQDKPDGISANDGPKEIRIERTDEFMRTVTPKDDFQMISHKFDGKRPGKMKLEKRMKQYREELKLNQMKNLEMPSLSSEKMREAFQSKLSYIVTSRHVRPGYALSCFPDFASLF